MRRLALVILALLAGCAPVDEPAHSTESARSPSSTGTTPGAAREVDSAAIATPHPPLATPSGWSKVDERGAETTRWGSTVDARDSASAVLAVGCGRTVRLDNAQPKSAWEGLLRRDDLPGVALTFEFTDQVSAQRFLELWIAQMQACPPNVVTSLQVKDDMAWGRRVIDGHTWSESARRDANRVRFVAVGTALNDDELSRLDDLSNG